MLMAPDKRLVIFVFPTRGNLVEATQYISAVPEVDIQKTAVLARAEDGEVTVYDDDINPVEGAVTGGTLGALMGGLGIAGLGAFLLPGIGPLIALGIGAAAGGLVGGGVGAGAARLMDFGIDNERLEKIARKLETGQVAVVMQVQGEPEKLTAMESVLTNDYQAFVLALE
jgi:uncharacterized membrane protein